MCRAGGGSACAPAAFAEWFRALQAAFPRLAFEGALVPAMRALGGAEAASPSLSSEGGLGDFGLLKKLIQQTRSNLSISSGTGQKQGGKKKKKKIYQQLASFSSASDCKIMKKGEKKRNGSANRPAAYHFYSGRPEKAILLWAREMQQQQQRGQSAESARAIFFALLQSAKLAEICFFLDWAQAVMDEELDFSGLIGAFIKVVLEVSGVGGGESREGLPGTY